MCTCANVKRLVVCVVSLIHYINKSFYYFKMYKKRKTYDSASRASITSRIADSYDPKNDRYIKFSKGKYRKPSTSFAKKVINAMATERTFVYDSINEDHSLPGLCKYLSNVIDSKADCSLMLDMCNADNSTVNQRVMRKFLSLHLEYINTSTSCLNYRLFRCSPRFGLTRDALQTVNNGFSDGSALPAYAPWNDGAVGTYNGSATFVQQTTKASNTDYHFTPFNCKEFVQSFKVTDVKSGCLQPAASLIVRHDIGKQKLIRSQVYATGSANGSAVDYDTNTVFYLFQMWGEVRVSDSAGLSDWQDISPVSVQRKCKVTYKAVPFVGDISVIQGIKYAGYNMDNVGGTAISGAASCINPETNSISNIGAGNTYIGD